ncbi:GRAS family transcription factor [Actinidia rufa]|uniref:GRAS family transcription factor n=1 Tax=Actinidia rufa TaxID=165716 RepID=A0A7J0H719_9ERIC|nr:GRAS family transcription factor [Actinidia rufa]
MMQFTETPQPPPPRFHAMNNKNQIRPWPGFPTSKALGNFGDANCMEQLLVHCATAIETNDATLAQQILWVLNNIAVPDGDSNQRLTSNLAIATHKFSIIELAGFVDLTPWHRFGFTAANAAILEAVEGFPVVHIIDLSLTHCMQIPTLIDSIANRLEGPPLVKLTVAGPTEDVPPMLDLSYEELGTKLVNFAKSRNVTMEFRVIPSSSSDGFSTFIEQIRIQNLLHSKNREALVINSHMMLHYIPEETLLSSPSPSYRTMFLEAVRSLDPTIMVLWTRSCRGERAEEVVRGGSMLEDKECGGGGGGSEGGEAGAEGAVGAADEECGVPWCRVQRGGGGRGEDHAGRACSGVGVEERGG